MAAEKPLISLCLIKPMRQGRIHYLNVIFTDPIQQMCRPLIFIRHVILTSLNSSQKIFSGK